MHFGLCLVSILALVVKRALFGLSLIVKSGQSGLLVLHNLMCERLVLDFILLKNVLHLAEHLIGQCESLLEGFALGLKLTYWTAFRLQVVTDGRRNRPSFTGLLKVSSGFLVRSLLLPT